jgi:hypothetical protein
MVGVPHIGHLSWRYGYSLGELGVGLPRIFSQETKDHGTEGQGTKSREPRLGGYTVSLVSLFKAQIDLIQI